MRLALATLLLSGCIRMAHPPRAALAALAGIAPPSARCTTLASRVTVLHVLGIVFGGLGSGATAAAPAISAELPRDLVLGGGGLFGLAGAVVAYLGGVSAASYSKECP